jgi:hypothetical protein
LTQGHLLGFLGGQHQGQIERRLVLRLHGRGRRHDALHRLHAEVGVALDVVVADGET